MTAQRAPAPVVVTLDEIVAAVAQAIHDEGWTPAVAVDALYPAQLVPDADAIAECVRGHLITLAAGGLVASRKGLEPRRRYQVRGAPRRVPSFDPLERVVLEGADGTMKPLLAFTRDDVAHQLAGAAAQLAAWQARSTTYATIDGLLKAPSRGHGRRPPSPTAGPAAGRGRGDVALMNGVRVEAPAEIEDVAGPRPPSHLAALAGSWRDVQQARLAATQRGLAPVALMLCTVENQLAAALARELRAHPIWPWLSQFPGLRGVHVARVIAAIDDPRRFPGQRCSAGHTSPPDHAIGAPCPAIGRDDEPCDGTMLAPRTTTGTRSLWHYLGLHADVDGRSPRKRKGHQGDWNPQLRAACLQPGGLAEQIVRLRVPVYRDIYDSTKERLIRDRADGGVVIVHERGPVPSTQPRVDGKRVIDARNGPRLASQPGGPLRPYQVDAIARKVAVKAFVGDLLAAWKAVD